MRSGSWDVLQGDCCQLLTDVQEKSVDLMFVDPPFNIGYDYDEYDDQQEDEHYLDWCQDWIGLCYDKLSERGSMHAWTTLSTVPTWCASKPN